MQPMMTASEIEVFRGLVGEAGCYVEFGSGGSTIAALHAGARSVVSVESSADWLATMRTEPAIVEAEARGNLTFVKVDIGPTRNLGFPVDDASARKWPSYYTDVWTRLQPDAVDLVLVDGRFRVPCALSALLRCDRHTPLLMHDFWIRPQYHVVLEFADLEEQVDQLVVLRRKRSPDWRKLALTLSVRALDAD